ncbi:hypothetical protein AMECASPLE_015579 [Ameca splendens]|uniref:Uncharacterized protein n=1 Tax=Ameca splendens TaxID=208324 RepID=A0ABV0YP31_9TELE
MGVSSGYWMKDRVPPGKGPQSIPGKQKTNNNARTSKKNIDKCISPPFTDSGLCEEAGISRENQCLHNNHTFDLYS